MPRPYQNRGLSAIYGVDADFVLKFYVPMLRYAPDMDGRPFTTDGRNASHTSEKIMSEPIKGSLNQGFRMGRDARGCSMEMYCESFWSMGPRPTATRSSPAVCHDHGW
jgi:hypothetical protein